MQHLINMSLYEIRRDEYQQEMAQVNANGWKFSQRRPYREALAKALVTLAARLAPPTPVKDERGAAIMQQAAGS